VHAITFDHLDDVDGVLDLLDGFRWNSLHGTESKPWALSMINDGMGQPVRHAN
jgi:hypothetical protein